MRAFGIGLVAALALNGFACGAERDDGTHWLLPPEQTLRAKWPHDAAGHLIYGEVYLNCGIGSDGSAADCRVESSTSSDPILAKAALDLTPLFKALNRPFDRAVVDIDMKYDERALPLKAPSLSRIQAAYPKDAKARGVSGSAVLKCAVTIEGHLHDCSIESEEEPGAGFGAAALSLAREVVMKPATRLGQPVESETHVAYSWGSSPHNTDPDWLQKPTLDAMLAIYPAKAKGRSGMAQIRCVVKIDGLLRACEVDKETPEGAGFGSAALLLAPTFLMTPARKDGRAVEAVVTIPIAFGPQDFVGNGREIRVVTTPTWDKTPTVQEILAELDKKVGDRFADGKVTFQCTVSKKTGGLSDCINISTSPGMAGFKGAAQALTSKFVVDKEFVAGVKEDVRVNLAFSFPDMQSEAWSKRYLLHPVWLRTVNPDPKQPIFPDAAAKAGLKTGSATVDCILATSGALTNCTVVSESNPGVGFGEMAIRIAEVFVANPWTEDGLPADGAHVRMPIRMNYEPQAEQPADSPPPAPAPSPKP